MPELEQVPLTDELLSLMRNAASTAVGLQESFITPRVLLLAMLDDPTIGLPISAVVNRERVIGADVQETHAARLPDDTFSAGDAVALTRYDTISFKTPDGVTSMWLSRDAHNIFIEGARRVEERYQPRHLALGFAAEAVHAPGVLSAIRVEPGALMNAIYKL